MLAHISWTTYLLSVLAAVLVYYLWFGIQFYRKGIAGNFDSNFGTNNRQSFTPPIAPVMGAVAEEPEKVTNSDELVFGESAPDESVGDQLNSYDEPDRLRLRKEAEALISVIAESAEPKAHFLLLAGLLTEKYASVTDSEDREQIVQRFLDPSNGFAFELKAEDLNELWREPINI
ncbi:hypothetical protein INP83_06845 [Mucilaginibacter sp. 21P]|uniref:hypothetical protein n=1 Tax=Mucilaginibacter sp. 21P TaxID=2778902 RepID=UPI001C5622D9|nr:hypothetical protein [Mucilaginibacter sp. 21P]QXV66797.1 hypothetical protein INP83_06845 [Mucilaginibacter sp. 21P]